MIPDVYARDDEEILRQKQATPRATALLQEVHEAEARTLDLVMRKSLEAMRGALALHSAFKEDLTEVGEREYRKRLELIVGAAK